MGLETQRLVLFLGSFHPPNLQAARYILTRLAPAFPSALFVIAGGVSRGLTAEHLPENVALVGRYSEDAKDLLLTAAHVALNPMFAGSGTNVKVLEYLAHGVPTITTTVGARGLDLVSGRHALIADEDEFPRALDTLLSAQELRVSLMAGGRRLVEERFDWRAVAASVYTRIAASLGVQKRPQLTVLNDFPCFPPTHGGKIRLYNFYTALSAHYDIDVVCYDNARTRIPTCQQLGGDALREIRVPKTRLHIMTERWLRRALGSGVEDVVAMLLAPWDRRFHRVAGYSMARSHLVIASHIYLYSVAARFKGRRIYDALNCEYVLKQQVLTSWLGRALLPFIRRQEEKACRGSSEIFTTSNEDAEALMNLYSVPPDKFISVPNGARVKSCEPTGSDERQRARSYLGLAEWTIVTFLGSAHPPNVEAARWIASALAPSLGDRYRVLLVGSVCWGLDARHRPSNLMLFYEVEEDIKRELLRVTDIAINPVTSGSGTNVKMLEYMAWGLPIVTTPTGARGLPLAQNVHAVICERGGFAGAIRSLVSDPILCESIGSAARALVVARYDWERIAASTLSIISRTGETDAQPACDRSDSS